jgi:hypothetical protein
VLFDIAVFIYGVLGIGLAFGTKYLGKHVVQVRDAFTYYQITGVSRSERPYIYIYSREVPAC